MNSEAEVTPAHLDRCATFNSVGLDVLRRRFFPGSHPTKRGIYLRLFKLRPLQPVNDVLTRITIFNWSGKTIQLVIDANTKREIGVLLHRNLFRQIPESGNAAQNFIRPHKKEKRRDRSRKCEGINSPVRQASSYLACSCD